MIKNKIDEIKRTQRLILTPGQYIQHFFIVVFPLFIAGLFLWNDIMQIKEAYIWILFSIAIVFWYIQYRKLKFTKFRSNCTNNDLYEALKLTSDELEWTIKINEDDFCQATSDDPISYMCGDLITIIKTESGFIINSISDPERRSLPLISISKRNNIRTFTKHLTLVINKQREIKDYSTPKNEWTYGKIVTRLVLYPLSIFIISINLFILFDSIDNAVIAIGGILIASGYIYFDVKGIIKRRKYIKRNNLNRK